MSKVMIEVKVPAATMQNDLAIPYEKPLFESVELLKALYKENGLFVLDETTIFCAASDKAMLDLSHTPEELRLRNGDILILF